MHVRDPKDILLRDPKHINDKEARERVNQYNLKHKDDKRTEVSENRLDKPPQSPIIPKTDHLHATIGGDGNSDYEEYQDDKEYNYEEDEIEDGAYDT